MTEVSTIGLDLTKDVFRAHGADVAGAVLFRERLRREHVLVFFAAQPPCLVAMEACPGAHYWGRNLGHTVKVIAPAYVKSFVKRQKNDAADAEAICEAAQRLTIRFVAVKRQAKQASALIFPTGEVLVGPRTQLINAIRGHPAEYGPIAPQGPLSSRTADRTDRGSRTECWYAPSGPLLQGLSLCLSTGIAKSDLFGYGRALRRIVRCNHRIVRGQAVPGSVAVRCEAVRVKVPLQRFVRASVHERDQHIRCD
ncbi:hypothetical protein FHR71_005465 [Methylobacterium sp. RAS18]|nr:hypothetical protein [Methylobacterium sp. RAS18]